MSKSFLDKILTSGLVPDAIVRFGIRRLLTQRLKDENRGSVESNQAHLMQFIEATRNGPIALSTDRANEQHYEVPALFFQTVLGKRLKYSSGYWSQTCRTLDQAEEAMLELTCRRAGIQNGQNILELGCGWGSLSLWIAEHYPASQVTGVSNSRWQKEYIDSQIKLKKIDNLKIVTRDMNQFECAERFDRIVSVEMFEHMRNLEVLLKKISGWLNDDGRLFVHIFCHKKFSYLFEDKDESDWMARYFFTGGMMPSRDLLLYFQKHLRLMDQWQVSGNHYSKTAEAWLCNMDANKSAIMKLFDQTYGKEQSKRWWSYWRIFFMACAELWGYRNGEEWFVSHYLFGKQ